MMEIRKGHFGTLGDGSDVPLYTLVNEKAMRAEITPYGGIVRVLTSPDREGRMGDVVLGFDTLDDYVDHNPFFGCLVGRYANRIAGGTFELDGVEYEIARPDGEEHALHGGVQGFDRQLWQSWARESWEGPALELRLISPDGDQGFPGTLSVAVTYTLLDEGGLKIDYVATTDHTTVVNLTNHSYFNLSGMQSATILDHELMVNADAFTPVDAKLIPTGEVLPVEGTPLDFRDGLPDGQRIGARIDADHPQIRKAGGYDHNWVLNGDAGRLRLAAQVYEPGSGRLMTVYTTEPGVQVYTSNMLPEGLPGKDGRVYGRHAGLCLETQHYPDSPNQPDFSSTTLEPGQTFRSTTVYRFSTL
jgi:aldose 1-epimerase